MALTNTNLATPLGRGGGEDLADADFAYVADLVGERAAIEVSGDKRYLVEQRLTAVVRAEGLASIAALVARSRADGTGRTAGLIVDAMTTNETSFFRDARLYDFLRTDLLPEIVERNRGTRTLRIWSAACSSGQEPYSLAILLREHFPDILASWNVRILATDISPTMVERTRAGRYGRLEVNRGLPADLLLRHFSRDGLEWQVDPALRRIVDARELNLARTLPLAERFDLVLLRNVLIYFSLDTKREVLGRVRDRIAPGGALVLGSSESTMQVDDTWVRRSHGNICCYLPTAP